MFQFLSRLFQIHRKLTRMCERAWLSLEMSALDFHLSLKTGGRHGSYEKDFAGG